MSIPQENTLEVSTGEPEALAAIANFADDLLSMGPHTARIFDAAKNNPECGLLQTYAGILHLYAMTTPENAVANQCFDRARVLGGNARELAVLEAAQTWHNGNYEGAMDLCEDITRQWPRDVVAAKIAEFNYFLGGQYWNRERFAMHMERIIGANPENPYLLGMHAFAQELSGNLEQCQASAELATERERRNPWAHHALAHLYTRQAKPAAGITWLEGIKDTWQQCGSAIRVHNFWHLALLHLDQRDTTTARHLFDNEVFVRDHQVVGIHIDAISLLWRLELAGADVGPAWPAVADACEPRAGDFTIPYIAAHHAYAFARAGRQGALEKTRESAARLLRETQGNRETAWRRVGTALVEGAIAFGSGDMKRAARTLGPAMNEIGRGGGSDAQIDLFRQTYLVATGRSGERSLALDLWKRRVGSRKPTLLEEFWHAELSEGSP